MIPMNKGTYEEAMKDYIPAYPPEECDGQCYHCGHSFDEEEWEVQHYNFPVIGESWVYECPSCYEQTVEVAT